MSQPYEPTPEANAKATEVMAAVQRLLQVDPIFTLAVIQTILMQLAHHGEYFETADTILSQSPESANARAMRAFLHELRRHSLPVE